MRRRRAVRAVDEGFTLVEIMLAMFIVASVMASMLGILVSSLSTIAQARQRQTATALATQTLESLRALPYDSVIQPDGSTPDASLQFLAAGGPPYVFNADEVLPDVASQPEQLVVNQWSGRDRSQTVNEVTYRIETYVSRAPINAAGQQTFNITVVVSWVSTVHPQGRMTAQRSVAYSPPGCLSTANSPFAAPCQAYFTAQAGQAVGGIMISNPNDSTAPVLGFAAAGSGTSLELGLAGHGTHLLVEQTASANGRAHTTGARKVLVPEPLSVTTTGAAAVAAVDSDPSSADGMTANNLVSGTAGALSLDGDAGTLIAYPSSDAGTGRAAILGESAYCTGLAGTPLATGPTGQLRPCSSSQVQPGASRITYQPEGAFGFGSTTIPLVQIGSSGVARAISAQLAAANADACIGGSGAVADGCSYAAANRSLSSVWIGRPGAGTGPADPNFASRGILTLTSLAESVRTEEGNGARQPSFTRSGTLWVWADDGTGVGAYQSVNLADFAAPPSGSTPASKTWIVPPTSILYTSPSTAQMIISFQGTVTVQRPQLTRTPATRTGNLVQDCRAEACVSEVTGGSTVISNLTVTITRNGTLIGEFAIAGNLGGLVSQATYKAAADA